jgi:hypothetical protein
LVFLKTPPVFEKAMRLWGNPTGFQENHAILRKLTRFWGNPAGFTLFQNQAGHTATRGPPDIGLKYQKILRRLSGPPLAIFQKILYNIC